MVSSIIHLSGFPGVGKLTIAQEIAKRPNHILADGHLINNPIFKTFGADGVTPLPDHVWNEVTVVRKAVFRTMVRAPLKFSYVMTNVLVEDTEDREVVEQIQEIARHRNSQYFPIVLTCELAENRRRIVGADRAANFKAIDPDDCDRMRAGKPQMLFEDHLNRFCLDTTHIAPVEAAKLIMAHIDQVLRFGAAPAEIKPDHPLQ